MLLFFSWSGYTVYYPFHGSDSYAIFKTNPCFAALSECWVSSFGMVMYNPWYDSEFLGRGFKIIPRRPTLQSSVQSFWFLSRECESFSFRH